MKSPDWRIAASLGIVLGLTISWVSVVSRSGADLSVQAIELQGGPVVESPDPLLRVVDGPATPMPTGGVPPSPTPSLEPAPRRTPAVVAPIVLSERPRATPKQVPTDDADDPEDTPDPDDPDETPDPDDPDDTPDSEDTPDPDDPDDAPDPD
jgi:hypothetical protein